jgi:hypothetical protein
MTPNFLSPNKGTHQALHERRAPRRPPQATVGHLVSRSAARWGQAA